MTAHVIELTVFTKDDGPLTKRISLSDDGKVNSDGSACTMVRGKARRTICDDVTALAALIAGLGSNQALALGALRPDLNEQVEVVTKDKLNGTSGVIARTADYIKYAPGKPAAVLLDYDSKGMPDAVKAKLEAAGGFWAALCGVAPELAHAPHVIRASTSAGLHRTDSVPGSGGQHAYIVAQDGTDAERFLKTLHERCWLAGFGWYVVGKAGQLLERSIVDRMVGAPERLVFEGAPVVVPPLAQDQDKRAPQVHAGEMVGTMAACLPLTTQEKEILRKLLAEAKAALQSEAAIARQQFIAEQAQRLMDRNTGMTKADAERIIAEQCKGILLPFVELPFDDEELAGSTVADVLANPARFAGCTLADPIEGVGRCKAKVLLRDDGKPFFIASRMGVRCTPCVMTNLKNTKSLVPPTSSRARRTGCGAATCCAEC